MDNKTVISNKSRLSVKELALTGMSAAILAVISQISLPMPTGVPITIQIFGVALTGLVLGSKLGALSALIYVLIGAVGLPVFSNFSGGFQSLIGLTGGYIWTWPAMAFLCGMRPKTKNRHLTAALSFLFPILGTLLNEAAGGLQWAALSGDMSVRGVFAYAITAFIPKDIVLTILAVIVSNPIKRAVSRQF